MSNSKVTATQVAILLFLSRSFNVLNYIPAFSNTVQGIPIFIGAFIALIIQFIIMIPAFILYKRFDGSNVIDVALNKNKYLGSIISIIYFIIIIFNVIGSISGFTYFMTDAIYPNSSIIFIVISISTVCFIAAKYKLEGLARTSTIIFVYFIVGIIIICITSIKSFQFLNIRPLIDESITPIINATKEVISTTSESFIFILLIPLIKGNPKKSIKSFFLMTFVFIEIINVFLAGVLGEFGRNQTFPFFSLATIAQTSLFQRFDSIHMTLWVIVSFIKITLFILVGFYCLKSIIPKKIHGISYFITFLICVIGSSLLSSNNLIFYSINMSSTVIIITLTTIIPLVLLLITKKQSSSQTVKN